MVEESRGGERWREKEAKSEKSKKNKSIICFVYPLTKQSIDSITISVFLHLFGVGFSYWRKRQMPRK